MEQIKTENSLSDRCISCLIENVTFLPESHLFTLYKEIVGNQCEKKVRGVRILFCENCADVLESFKAFRLTCLDSLGILQSLLEEKVEVPATGDEETEKVPVKVELETDNESEGPEQDSDYNPGEYYDDMDEPEDEDEEMKPHILGEIKSEDAKVKAKRKRRRREGEKLEKNCHKCSECDKAFPRPANLRNHFLKKHRNAKHCKYCQKAFEDEKEFEKHMVMEQQRINLKKEKEQKLHVCEVCGLTTKFRSNLVKHMDTHLPDDNSVKCDICQKTFKSLMLLKNHIMYHKEKTFVCTLCGRKFLFAKDLERHGRLVHEKLTQYTQCSICNKQVSAKGLNSHVKQVHMDIRPHTCPVCNLAFKSSSNLKKHLYSHSGTRPYNCHLCGHGSYMSCTLKEHYQKIHGLTFTNDELNQVCIKTSPSVQVAQLNRSSAGPTSQTTASSSPPPQPLDSSQPQDSMRNAEILVTFPPGLQVNVHQVGISENSISNG